MGNSSSKILDQFYTNSEASKNCINMVLPFIGELGYLRNKLYFLEPSAGEGSFIDSLITFSFSNFYAFDIDPKREYILKHDFLNENLSSKIKAGRENIITIGNPPFGKRSKIAIEFINKSFEYSNTVIFILPLHFEKYSSQNKIHKDAKLIFSYKLDPNIFKFQGKNYSVRCCLQIWTLLDSNYQNIRILNSPQINHTDFKMWQYNNTPQAEKYFDKKVYEWDFAVPRQGYKNYNLRVTEPKELDKKTQWIFFKAKNKSVLNRLINMDFTKLSQKNTSTPGFGKADVIIEYKSII